MRAFFQSLDEKVWQAVEIGWTKSKKASADWDDAKIKAANFNSRALNVLFIAVMNEEFKKISSTKTAKDEFYAKLKDIVNSTFTLGETIPEPKLLERCLDLYPRDFMPRSPRLRNRRILTKFL